MRTITTTKITLIGLLRNNPDLFSELVLPDGYDIETFTDSLLLEHGEKSALYSDADFMQKAIAAWGRKWYLELQRIQEALSAEYDPIYNYDRYEEYTDSEQTQNQTQGRATDTQNATDTETRNLQNTTSAQNSNEHKVSAFNSSTYQPDNEDAGTGSGSATDSGTVTNAHTGTTSDLTSTGTNDTDRTLTHEAHLYGNIGVTTAATMVTEVVQQRIKYNLYGAACRLFANELLIGIY